MHRASQAGSGWISHGSQQQTFEVSEVKFVLQQIDGPWFEGQVKLHRLLSSAAALPGNDETRGRQSVAPIHLLLQVVKGYVGRCAQTVWPLRSLTAACR